MRIRKANGLNELIVGDIWGQVDLTDFQKLLLHPKMQNLNQVKQLGALYFYLMNAVHTRYSHAIGTFFLMWIRANWLYNIGKITHEELLALCVAALVHDIGHGPFSHLVELQRGNHEVWGIKIVESELAEICEDIGAPLSIVLAILRRTSPLSGLLYDTVHGVDKLDYLTRDPYFVFGEKMSFDGLISTDVNWDREKGLYVLPAGHQLALDATNKYWGMYARVYEHPKTRLHQRYLQALLRLMTDLDKVVAQQFEAGGEDGVIGAIGYWCEHRADHPCAERFWRFRQRAHPQETLVFSPHPNQTPLNSMPCLAKLECDHALLELGDGWGVERLADLEEGVANILNVSPTHVSITPPPPERRWKVPSMKVECQRGNIIPIGEHFPALNATAQMSMQMSRNIIVSFVGDDLRQKVATDSGAHTAIRELLSSS